MHERSGNNQAEATNGGAIGGGATDLLRDLMNAVHGGNANDVRMYLMNAFRLLAQPNAPAALDPLPQYMVAELFRRSEAPTFNGQDGPSAVEEWLEDLEQIFTRISFTDEQRIRCAVFQFTEDAYYWWDAYKRVFSTEEQRREMTWEGFKELVMKKYVPQSYLDQKCIEFLYLKQGEMSVVEYERRFNELSRYATHHVDTDNKKATWFQRGLRPGIGAILAGHGLTTYAEMMERAQAIWCAQESPAESLGKRKRYNEDNGERKKGKESNVLGRKPQCAECGKHHNGECLYGKGVCYRCKEPGHQVMECPRRGPKEPEKRGNAPMSSVLN